MASVVPLGLALVGIFLVLSAIVGTIILPSITQRQPLSNFQRTAFAFLGVIAMVLGVWLHIREPNKSAENHQLPPSVNVTQNMTPQIIVQPPAVNTAPSQNTTASQVKSPTTATSQTTLPHNPEARFGQKEVMIKVTTSEETNPYKVAVFSKRNDESEAAWKFQFERMFNKETLVQGVVVIEKKVDHSVAFVLIDKDKKLSSLSSYSIKGYNLITTQQIRIE